MKLVIDPAGLVTDAVALQMVFKILDRDDGIVRFTDGFAVLIKTSKTQKFFKVVKICDND